MVGRFVKKKWIKNKNSCILGKVVNRGNRENADKRNGPGGYIYVVGGIGSR